MKKIEYRNDIFSEENILLHENEEDALYNKIKTSQLKSKSFYYESYHPVIEKSKSIIDEKINNYKDENMSLYIGGCYIIEYIYISDKFRTMCNLKYINLKCIYSIFLFHFRSFN